jgi:hypothetical protein
VRHALAKADLLGKYGISKRADNINLCVGEGNQWKRDRRKGDYRTPVSLLLGGLRPKRRLAVRS